LAGESFRRGVGQGSRQPAGRRDAERPDRVGTHAPVVWLAGRYSVVLRLFFNWSECRSWSSPPTRTSAGNRGMRNDVGRRQRGQAPETTKRRRREVGAASRRAIGPGGGESPDDA
jgi:hypothetical protein